MENSQQAHGVSEFQEIWVRRRVRRIYKGELCAEKGELNSVRGELGARNILYIGVLRLSVRASLCLLVLMNMRNNAVTSQV